jgi:GMP synthase (glutamine-hydrolysing)
MAPEPTRIGILATGDPVPPVAARWGSFAAMIVRALRGDAPLAVHVFDARADSLPRPDAVAGWVLTGSPASVTEAPPWLPRATDWVRSAVGAGVPVFGICFGHQLLAHALGGRVERNPLGREIGTVELRVTGDDPLLPAAGSAVPVHATHLDSAVLLPPGARVLGHTAQEPNAAVRFAPAAWGVQFHPEFDAEILRGYVEERVEELRAEGLEPERVLAAVRPTTQSTEILRRFVARCGAARGPGG